jgi:protein-disulfide isomerase
MINKNILLVLSIITTAIILTGCIEENSTQNNIAGQSTTNQNVVNVDNPSEQLLKYAITTGPQDSAVSIIVASDFECPACRSTHQEFKKTIEEYYDQVQFGYIAYPLSYHPDALTGAKAVEAAQLQGKGWEMFERLFEDDVFDVTKIELFANELDIDMDQFDKDMSSQEVENKINQSMKLLNQLNLTGTPTYYINGVEFTKSITKQNLSQAINEKL